MNDLAGIDVGIQFGKRTEIYGDQRQSVILDRVLKPAGMAKRLTVAGTPMKRAAVTARLNQLLKTLSLNLCRTGFQRRPFSNEEILERYVYALINTAPRCWKAWPCGS